MGSVLRIVSTEADMVLLLLCLLPSLSLSQDVRPGHDYVKEHHMHVYWFQCNQQQTNEALRLRDLLVEEVAAKRLLVVLPGVTSDILPGLDDSKIHLLDNTRDAMWLGSTFPMDTSVLDPTGGHDPQYPELGLGYSAA